jgi:hypothetical protein
MISFDVELSSGCMANDVQGCGLVLHFGKAPVALGVHGPDGEGAVRMR